MEIKLISVKTCDIQTFKTKHKFRVIRQAHNQTLVGAGDDGLYVTSDKEITSDNNWIKLQEGRYSDIFVYDNRFSVLEYDTCKVVTYELIKDKVQWVQQGVIQIQEISGSGRRSATMLYYKGTFIIRAGKLLVKYRENNQLIKQITCDIKQCYVTQTPLVSY